MTTAPATTDAMPDAPANGGRHYGFVLGLISGGVIGVGLGMLFAPRAVLDLRQRAAGSARHLGDAAADRYRRASTRVGDVVDEITRKGQDLRDGLADAVVRGAKGVERVATDAKTGH